MIIIITFFICSLLYLIYTDYHVWGLRGGYNKGVWAETSTYMRQAQKNKALAWVVFFLLAVTIFIVFSNEASIQHKT